VAIRVEAVTVSVGYGDFLAATLPENLPLLDTLVVATSPDDEETRAVCRHHNVRHVLSEDYKRGGPFNKARMINRALDLIGGHDWILHLDADIVLPRQFRNMVDWAHLDETILYGADRQRIIGWEEWQAFKKHVDRWDNHAHEMGHWFHPKYPTMSRLVSSIHGYTPIGAFQLFHGTALIEHNYHVRHYPIEHGDAARTDMQFALQWDRRNRALLPEVILLHLESTKSGLGVNWKGRTTPRFGPERSYYHRHHHHPSQPRHHHPHPR
jgi:hypothetical protein